MEILERIVLVEIVEVSVNDAVLPTGQKVQVLQLTDEIDHRIVFAQKYIDYHQNIRQTNYRPPSQKLEF